MDVFNAWIWDFSCEPSLTVTEHAMTGRETPQARPSACLLGTNTYGTFCAPAARARQVSAAPRHTTARGRHLVLAQKRQVQQNLNGLRVRRHHNKLGDASVQCLCRCSSDGAISRLRAVAHAAPQLAADPRWRPSSAAYSSPPAGQGRGWSPSARRSPTDTPSGSHWPSARQRPRVGVSAPHPIRCTAATCTRTDHVSVAIRSRARSRIPGARWVAHCTER